MTRIAVLPFLFGVLHVTLGQRLSPDPLCIGCVMVNGAGYNNHVDCDKFIQCNYNEFGVLVGEIMDCPFATHWDMDTLTCLPIGETQCNNDRCLNLPQDSEYSVETNCRGYMKCSNGISLPMCCEANKIYVEKVGCVDDLNDDCNDTCFAVSETVITPLDCDKFPVTGKPNMYMQNVAGWGDLLLPCPPGTLFMKETCACLMLTDKIFAKAECKPEIYLPFTVDHTDQSGKKNYVYNENVEVRNGVAVFNGNNSRLVIPRFTNLEHNTDVIIKVKYSSKHESFTGMARTLVSNADCGAFPSIMLSEDNRNIYFGVGTNEARFAYTFIQQGPNSEKEVEYRFNNGELIGNNGITTDVVEAPGYLRNVRCAIQIGFGETSRPGKDDLSLLPFEGEIDELSIYLCNPDKP